jgi:glycosyltransferase involved in cell wall biosynthesis
MRIVVDYRAALRARTGVGEYIHELIRAYRATHGDEIVLFTSSWKDRPDPRVAADLGAQIVDRRIPVKVLNYLWHRASWPPIESLAGRADVVHSAHPLLIPSKRAAQVVTIHDLFFLANPERTHAEIRRDYPVLARDHALRADAIITSTAHTRGLVAERFGVPEERIYVCPPGAPSWQSLGRGPNVPEAGYVLFIGTLEPRKNVGVLLDAYEQLAGRWPLVPRLVLAGGVAAGGRAWLDRIARAPLSAHVRHVGYVANQERETLFAGARLLVLPSLDEGFGLPALEAMSAGVPVIVSRRGSLPEVVAQGGTFIEPDDVDGLAAAIERAVCDRPWAEAQARAGLARAAAFTWTGAATRLREAYTDAMGRRRGVLAPPKPGGGALAPPKRGEGALTPPKPGGGA